MGIDLSQYDLDEPIGNVKSNAIQSVVANFQEAAEDGSQWTVRDIARHGAIGGLGPFVVGSGSEIADHLEEWVRDTDVDGFNLAYAITPGSFEDVVKWVIPELQKRGSYPTEYTEGTLRNKLHGRGDRLPDEHRGAGFRVGARVPS
jgi:alkanesulfonate monooxygenase SsuD/methylene tetrahydromethanopterin reductase-like flavin-dependent oxidoreductase (luciferase family)